MGGPPNAIARAREELARAGAAVTELTDSNPTRHGLLLPEVVEAVARASRRAARYEPHPRGDVTAREALAQQFGGHPDDYWLTASTSQSYSWLLALLADPGQAVATPAPGYPLVAPLARFAGVGTTPYRLHYAHPHGWILDLESLSRAANEPNVRALIAVSPGNPTGAYLGGAIDDLVAVCAPRQLPLIADEVFAPFALGGAASTIAGEQRIPTFALGGLSKLLCAPQLKLAWIRLSGPPDLLPGLRDALDSIADLFLPVSGPVAAALPDLLALADTSVAATRRRLAANLTAAHTALAGTAFRVRRCEGGWNIVADVPPGIPTQDLALQLLQRARLAVHPGWFYDLADDGALVVSLLPEPHEFESTLGRLRDAVATLMAP